MQPIKIVLVIASLRTGGKEKLVIDLLRHLNPERFSVTVCVMNGGELLSEIPPQITVHANLAQFKGDVIGFAARLGRILRTTQPDLVYCLSYRIPSWVSRLWAAGLHIPVIYELHGVGQVGDRHLDITERLLFNRLTAHMIAIGNGMRDNFIHDGFPANQITVIPNGIDTERYRPQINRQQLKASILSVDADTPLIGCIAQLRPEKNLGLLLRVFANIRQSHPNTQLIMVGDGSERPTLEGQIQQLGLGDGVQLLGMRSDIPNVLNCFDVMVLTSSTEASPLVILEAGACGVPVVATDVGEIHQMIIDGKTGLLAPNGDQTALTEHIRTLLNDDALRQMMGMAARDHIQTQYSIRASVAARETLFQQLTHTRKVHRATS